MGGFEFLLVVVVCLLTLLVFFDLRNVGVRWMPKMVLWPTTEHEDVVETIIQALRERQAGQASDRAYALDGVLRRYGVISSSSRLQLVERPSLQTVLRGVG